MNKAHLLKGFLLLIICLLAIGLSAEITSSKKSGPIEIEGENYKAVLDKDGCLTNLQINGKEFFAPGVSISRGSYFYSNGALSLPDIEEKSSNIFTAQNDKASIQYEFKETSMTWTLKNKTKEKLVFFIVLSDKVEAVMNENNDILSTVIKGNSRKTTWFLDNSSLEISGINKQWGPWALTHQVCEASLDPEEERQIELKIGDVSENEKERIQKLSEVPDDKDITLLSPKNYQVFQRQSIKEGRIIISGRVKIDADRIEYRIIGDPLHGRISKRWKDIPLVKGSKSFNTTISLESGGWYRFELHAKKKRKIVAETVVDKFGVGEVFVGAGQSNSTNCGQFKTKQKSGMVSSFSGEHWQIADDPQPGVADKTQGGSFWPAFGDTLYEKYKVPIGVATTGYGGTSINKWQPGDDLFKWTMTRIHQLGPQGFRALLWHQGESDVVGKMSTKEYYNKLKRVIITSKNNAGWEFPWFVAQVSYLNIDQPSNPEIRNAHQLLWDDRVALQGPDTDTLTGDNRDFDGKGIHFSPQGLKNHGVMWADILSKYIDSVLE